MLVLAWVHRTTEASLGKLELMHSSQLLCGPPPVISPCCIVREGATTMSAACVVGSALTPVSNPEFHFG